MTRPNSVTTNYTYDNLSRLLSVLHQLAGSTIDGTSYALDNAGNRTSKTDQRASVTSNYAYDAIYQLTQVTQGANTTESYSYDPVGNRTASLGVLSYTTNSSNELTATPSTNYTYDSNGNTLTKADSTGTTTYAWDFENRLSSVTLPGTGGTVTFKYDPMGRRIEKVSPATTSIFAYDGDNLIEETNATGTIVARYSLTDNIDEPLAMLRSGATSYYNVDGLGSVTSLSNVAGALAQTYTFDSFGKQTASSGSLTNPFQYTAREFDSETSLYFYRARYFDPVIGRFLSEDPWDAEPMYEDSNLYVYVANNPTNYVDWYGLYTMKPSTPPLPLPSPALDQLLKCIEGRTGLKLVVTSTSEVSPPPPKPPTHGPNDPHRRGLGLDIRYPSDPDAVLNAAACCGAKNGLDEKKRHFPNTTADNMHLQLVPGPNPKNPGGDLPKNPKCGSCQ